VTGGHPRLHRWAPLLPALALAAVACLQMALSRACGLSPWKGGGFGMFSTLDARPFRYLRVYLTAPQRSEELAIPQSLEDAAAAAEILPTDAQLQRLARRIVERERSRGRPVAQVRIEVWREEFAPGSLAPDARWLRDYVYRPAE
jgi:hypothetical protein